MAGEEELFRTAKVLPGEKVVQLSPGVILHLLTLVILPVVVVVWGLMVMVAEMVV